MVEEVSLEIAKKNTEDRCGDDRRKFLDEALPNKYEPECNDEGDHCCRLYAIDVLDEELDITQKITRTLEGRKSRCIKKLRCGDKKCNTCRKSVDNTRGYVIKESIRTDRPHKEYNKTRCKCKDRQYLCANPDGRSECRRKEHCRERSCRTNDIVITSTKDARNKRRPNAGNKSRERARSRCDGECDGKRY